MQIWRFRNGRILEETGMQLLYGWFLKRQRRTSGGMGKQLWTSLHRDERIWKGAAG
jgi:hypothetical protein